MFHFTISHFTFPFDFLTNILFVSLAWSPVILDTLEFRLQGTQINGENNT